MFCEAFIRNSKNAVDFTSTNLFCFTHFVFDFFFSAYVHDPLRNSKRIRLIIPHACNRKAMTISSSSNETGQAFKNMKAETFQHPQCAFVLSLQVPRHQ